MISVAASRAGAAAVASTSRRTAAVSASFTSPSLCLTGVASLTSAAAQRQRRLLVLQLPSTARRLNSHAKRRLAGGSGPSASTRRSYSSSSSSNSSSSSSNNSSSSKTSGFSFSSFAKDHPFTFQLMVATGKTSAADLIVQTVAERKSLEEVDWKRNGIFVVFGFAYLGGFQYWLMVNKYRQWFPTMDRFAKLPFREKLKDVPGILDAGKMVLFDIVVHLPMLYFPTYYTVKEFVYGTTWNPLDWLKDGVAKYSRNLEEDLTAMVQLWGPSDCVQFVLPVHIRMPFRHIVSFFWTAYVSFTRGSIDPADAHNEGVPVDDDHPDQHHHPGSQSPPLPSRK